MSKFVVGLFFVIALFVLMALFGSFYTINEGERGVVLTNGRVTSVSDSGLSFKLPFVQEVIEMSVRDNVTVFKDMEAYSQDQQIANMRISVVYAINPGDVETIYARFGERYWERTIQPKAPDIVKKVFGKFNAVRAIQNRDELVAELVMEMRTNLVSDLVQVKSVQLEDISFSDAYEKSVEERMMAEVEVLKIRQNLEREKVNADIARAKAQGAADASLTQAKATAEATKLHGDAIAYSLKAQGQALKDNPSLIDLKSVEQWNGILPTTMPPGGTVPFLNVK